LPIATPDTAWRILSTPPMSGAEIMAYDVDSLHHVESGDLPPTLRLFRFREPTVSFGRLQRRESIQPLIPKGWETTIIGRFRPSATGWITACLD